MLKKIRLYLASAALLSVATACNSDKQEFETSVEYSSTQVQSFGLQANSKILHNLDSIYFSIDLVKGRIFNADSLPYGTPINKLLVTVTTDNCSAVEFHIPRPGQADSIINYKEHSTDSIDFSSGHVKLHVVSYDRIASRDYAVNVNVHQTVADSLIWNIAANAGLPTSLTAPVASATVRLHKDFYTLTADASGTLCLNVAATPADPGVNTNISLPFTPRIETFTATTDALFILADNGDLHTSIDGITWSSCSTNWVSITAPYGTALTGIQNVDGTYCHASYPGTATLPIPADFPVSGNSQAISYTTPWSPTSQIITMGGRKADGQTTPTVWAYDGSNWAKIADNTPMKIDGGLMFPYYVCETDTNTWITTTRSVFIAMCGRENASAFNGTTYISYDLGFHWKKAPEQMQSSATFPPLDGARAFICNETMTSRAIRPITEWDTPFIYLYGGYKPDGNLHPAIVRGVVNKLQFKPLQ